MAKRQIGKCRFYCDIPSYLKSVGKYYGISSTGFEDNPVPKKEIPFTMNPYQITTFQGGNTHHWAGLRFFINQDVVEGDWSNQEYVVDDELWKLFNYVNNDTGHHSTGWYAGVLGHNFASVQSNLSSSLNITQRFIGRAEEDSSTQHVNQDSFTEIVNYEAGIESNIGTVGKAKYDGYSLWEITGKENSDERHRFNVIEFIIESHNGTEYVDWGTEKLKIGAYTTGIFFEPEHSFDLKGSVTYAQEGIKRQTTVGGSTLTNINYLGVPDWGDQPAWTLQKTEGRDYTTVANRGRRQWQVGLSFVADDNMMDKSGNSNKFFNDTFDDIDGTEDAHSLDNFDASMSSFFKLSNMGALPFIFCPDSQADDLEFALCRITNKPSFKQVANNLFSTSLTITETW